MELELSALWGALKKLYWLALTLIIAFGFVGHQAADRLEKEYTATSTLVIELPAGSISRESTNSTARQLSDTYNLLIETDDFRKEIATLANRESAEGFHIELVIPPGSSHLNARVTHSNPVTALAVANATVDAIVADHQKRSDARLQQTMAALASELEVMRADQETLEQEMAALEAADETSSPRYRELSNTILRLDQRITDGEARADRILLDYQLSEPNLVPVKYSSPPTVPNNLRPEVAALLGALLGALVGAALITLWAATNNVVRDTSEWQRTSASRMLSEIPHAGQVGEGAAQVFIIAQPTSAPAEGIRMLVTGLDFAGFPNEEKSVLQVTSPGPSDGKTTVCANLAVHFAQLGKRVVLVDCDLHRPRLHVTFSVSRDVGLTTLLMNRNTKVQDVAARVALPGLFFIPSGPLPPNTVELFSSVHFERLVAQLKSDFDVVILDTPPILLFSDSHRIASRSDTVIAVGRLDKTKIADMERTIEAIEKTGSDHLGTVWVGSKKTKDHYYYRARRR